jgi:NADH dehydrogenase FAD-containing subunit
LRYWYFGYDFQFRLGRMIGLDRANRAIQLAPTLDEQGREVIPARGIGYDTLVLALGSTSNDFGTSGAAELQTTRDPDIFAFGDCAACPWPETNGWVPPRAQPSAPLAGAPAYRTCQRGLWAE